MKPISDLTKKGIPPEVCLRLVLAILAHGEPGQRVTLLQNITTSAQERLGDILEAAGGVLGPYTPAAKSMMATMHEAHGIDQRSNTNALSKLSKIAVGVTELSCLPYDPSNPGDTAVRMFDIIRKLGADAAALRPVGHGNRCSVCAELRRIGEDDLLIPADEQRKANRIPTKKKEKTKAPLIGRRGRAVTLKPRTMRKGRADTDDDSHAQKRFNGRQKPSSTPGYMTHRRKGTSGVTLAHHGSVSIPRRVPPEGTRHVIRRPHGWLAERERGR